MKKKKIENVINMSEKNLQTEGADSNASESVEKIRDILFGNQMKDYDSKFSRLENLLSFKLDEFKLETKKRLDSLEDYVKKELETLEVKLDDEKTLRQELNKNMSKGFEDTTQAIEEKTNHLSEMSSKNEKDLRGQILDQSKNLRDEISTSANNLSDTLKMAIEELKADKIDHSTLANLLTEAALRIGGEKLSSD